MAAAPAREGGAVGASPRKYIVFGASKGIGAAVAVQLASNGYSVSLVARNARQLRDVAERCRKAGGWAHICVADVVTADMDAVVAQCLSALHGGDRVGAPSQLRLDGIVYNAGVQHMMHSAAVGLKQEGGAPSVLEHTLDVNFRSCVRAVGACLPALISTGDDDRRAGRRGPCIVLLSSLATHQRAVPGMGIYYASKYAMNGYAGCLLEEVRHHGIKVSLICPGLVNTDMATGTAEGFARRAGGAVASDGTMSIRGKAVRAAWDIEPSQMIQPQDVAIAVQYVTHARATACPTMIRMDHTALAISALGAMVEQPPSCPLPPPWCKATVTRPTAPVAIITGASRGIGRDVALRLADEGCDLALVARNKDLLEDVAKQCRARGAQVVVFACDVSDRAALESAVHGTVAKLGNLSIVISNAGINRRKSALMAKAPVWDQVMDINFRAAMHLTRTALPYLHQARPRPLRSGLADGMRRGSASVVFISSNAATTPMGVPGQAAYFASKHALNGFAECVFEDVRGLDITISIIAPGLTNTALGVRPGPMVLLEPEDMIQGDDLGDAVSYVVNTPPRICPRLVELLPQQPVLGIVSAFADHLHAAEPLLRRRAKL